MIDLIGHSVGRYQIVERLGVGGMATVYRAHDERLERDVAIKFMRTEVFTDETFLKRFEREAKALARLSHPNIVKVLDYGEHEGMPYLVMEYVRGETLKQRLGKPIPWQEAARMLLPVAQALEYTHRQNIIHRDVKPTNFLVGDSGHLMLSDFGIAKILDRPEAVQLTGTGVGLGTPEYMAPEQGLGKPVDRRADIYSLGVVFYEMVTGRKPFQADTPMAVLYKQVTDPLPSPHNFVADLPDFVEQVIVKALAKKPEDRYQDMASFARALQDLAEKPASYMTGAQSADWVTQLAGKATSPGGAPAEQKAGKKPSSAGAKTPLKKSSRLWITCGALVVVGICITVVAVTGGFGALLAIFGPEPEGLGVDVLAPGTVAAGEEFIITVNLTNSGTKDITVDQIQIPNALLTAAVGMGSEPASSGQVDYGDATAYQFALLLAPGETKSVDFQFKSLTPGDFSGDLDVVVGTRRKTAGVRVVISEAQVASNPATPMGPSPTPGELIPFDAVVQIVVMVNLDGDAVQGWWGSGTIISPDGLILTNAHVVSSTPDFPVDDLIVALTVEQDQPPHPQYYAEILQVDAQLDIAVIRVSTDLDSNPVDAASLNLPYTQLGDSDQLKLGDALVILGYPSIGGQTITLTRGEVSGFTAESGYGNRAFIKTSATIAGGNSGGLAANQTGEIIGIPTQLGYGGKDQYADCRRLADTNEDGVVDERDSCIPTGGFINALRPINLAIPYIEAAQRGEVNVLPTAVPTPVVMLPTRSPSETQDTLIMQDDFSDPTSGWYEGTSDDSRYSYLNGSYVIDVYPEERIVWVYLGEDLDDVEISIDALMESPVGDSGHGILCRYQDENNFYGFDVTEDGYIAIWKRTPSDYIFLYDWQYVRELDGYLQGRLTAICEGDYLALAVDGIILAEVYDSEYTSGDIGVFVETYTAGDTSVAFDNFEVYQR
jgi:S1-C subfamily serine protease/predicted Ser/Thr protein kinase